MAQTTTNGAAPFTNWKTESRLAAWFHSVRCDRATALLLIGFFTIVLVAISVEANLYR